MTAQVDYVAVVFTATSGASGELLGSDERELVQLVWQLVDIKNKKVKKTNQNKQTKCIIKILISLILKD